MPKLGDIRNVRWGDDIGASIVGEVFEKRLTSNAFRHDHIPQIEIPIEVLFQQLKVDSKSEGAVTMREAVGDTVMVGDAEAAQAFVLEEQNEVHGYFSFSVPFGEKLFDDLAKDYKLVDPPFFVRDAVFINEDQTTVAFDYRLSEDDPWMPYSATSVPQPDNPQAHLDARRLHLVKKAGPIEAYTPPPYDAEAAKARAKSSVLAFIDQMDATINAQYTETEQKGWPALARDASAFLADDKAPAPALRLQAEIKRVPVAKLADDVLAYSAFNEILSSVAGGVRSNADELIDASDGSQQALGQILAGLQEIAGQVLAATQARDVAALKAAVTGW